MRLSLFACALLAGTALALPAGAQSYPGEDVTVNPQAMGTRVLLYPDGKHARVTHGLLQPGETDPNAPIHLHMPVRHRVAHAAKTRPGVATAAARPASPPPRRAAAAPAPSYDLFSYTPLTGTGTAQAAPPRPQPAKVRQATAQPSAKSAGTAKPPAKAATADTSDSGISLLSGAHPSTMSLTGAPPRTPVRDSAVDTGGPDIKGLSRLSSILFSPGAEEPAPSALDSVRAMSGELSSAISNGAARVQLYAYGGRKDDKSSDARRLSLKRALIVRQLLIDDGVPSENIDTHAMGGASDGALDRVDIYVKT